jgi:hypothetical protein
MPQPATRPSRQDCDLLRLRAAFRRRLQYRWKPKSVKEWAVSNPERRRALLQLNVSDEITPATRTAGHKTTMGIAELMQQMRAGGPMHNVPMTFVAAIMNALAEATMDFMIQDPANAKKHCRAGFDAFWRAIA